MEATRAREITASPVMVDVIHNGVPVYIESITNDNAAAIVYPLGNPSNRQKVSISNLVEQ